MTRIIIDRLTSEQKKLIHSYGDKWRQIAFFTEPIDRKKATEVLKAAYRLTALYHVRLNAHNKNYIICRLG